MTQVISAPSEHPQFTVGFMDSQLRHFGAYSKEMLPAGFAPAYWGGYGFGPGLFTGFLLGEALAPQAIFTDSSASGGGDNGSGDYGGGDFGSGNFGGGDFGGGDF